MNPTESAVDIVEVIDSAPYLGWSLAITILTILIMLVDGYDLQTMAFVAPAIVADWGITRADLIWVLNGNLIGMAIGSVMLGRLADRIGRKRAFIGSLLSLCAGSLLSAHAESLAALFVWRTLTGIGLGGLTPLAATFISEWTPRRVRSIAVACAVVSVPLGGMLGAMIAQRAIPSFGWRSIFLIGTALPLLFVLLAAWLLPESPKFLAQRPGQSQALAAMLNRLLRQPRFAGNEHFYMGEPAAHARHWLGVILGREYRLTTLLLWIAFAFNTLGLYSYANWLPTVLTSTGFTQTAALGQHQYFNFGSFFGAVGGAVLIGRYGSRLVGTGLALLGCRHHAADRGHTGEFQRSRGAAFAADTRRRRGLQRHAVLSLRRRRSFLPDLRARCGGRFRADHFPHRRGARRTRGRRLFWITSAAAREPLLLCSLARSWSRWPSVSTCCVRISRQIVPARKEPPSGYFHDRRQATDLTELARMRL